MKRIGVLFLVSTLAACQAVPGDGPLTQSILADAGKSSAELQRQRSAVFDIVDVNTQSAQIISQKTAGALRRRFGFGGRPAAAVIGVGDRLAISIFEAGKDGLFSTEKKKATKIDVVVQPDGKAVIPYVGAVRFAGLSLEAARQQVLKGLVGKAIEPDVIVSSLNTASRSVTVTGNVKKATVVPLGLAGETLSDVIAQAGGPSGEAYDSFVTLTRGKKSATVVLSAVIENPSENIYVQPGDEITVIRDPRQFTVLGAVRSNRRLAFGSREVSLIEAVGMAGGGRDSATDATGFFVFRFEEPEVVSSLLGPARFSAMVRKGMSTDRDGRYPIVYRFDMSKADSLLAGQTFSVKHRDIIYVSRHPLADISKFLGIVGQPMGVASSGIRMVNKAADLADN